MVNWLLHNGWWLAAASVVLSCCWIAAMLLVLVLLPQDYFVHVGRKRPPGNPRHSVARIFAAVLKNSLGALLLCIGLIMAIPLIPGPGILFIMLGVSLLNFPGKYALERYLVSRPFLLAPMNRIRAHWKRPPLVFGQTAPTSSP